MAEDMSDADGEESAAFGAAIAAVVEGMTEGKEVNPWLQEALQLEYTAVWRKLCGRAKWSERDLMAIGRGLDLDLAELMRRIAAALDKAEPGVLMVDGVEVEVEMQIGAACAKGSAQGLVAVKRSDVWTAVNAAGVGLGEEARELMFLGTRKRKPRKLRVALLDDDRTITEQAAMLIAPAGLESDQFESDEELIALLGTREYDAFVLDWRLARNTSESLIRAIRSSEASGKRTPIFVVTGALGSGGERLEQELARVVREFGCKTKEKPVRWTLFREEIAAEIRDASFA